MRKILFYIMIFLLIVSVYRCCFGAEPLRFSGLLQKLGDVKQDIITDFSKDLQSLSDIFKGIDEPVITNESEGFFAEVINVVNAIFTGLKAVFCVFLAVLQLVFVFAKNILNMFFFVLNMVLYLVGFENVQIPYLSLPSFTSVIQN